MPNFCVNKNQQANGDHEVHDLSSNCSFLPAPENRQALGFHATCRGAVQAAGRFYRRVNGCFYCAKACHTSWWPEPESGSLNYRAAAASHNADPYWSAPPVTTTQTGKTFGGRVAYTIDLTEKEAKGFDKSIAMYLEHATKVSSGRRGRRSQSSNGASSSGRPKEELANIRSWATENGFEVSARGRIKQEIVDAYHSAN